MYTPITDKQPLAYQDIEVITAEGKTFQGYRSVWGSDIKDATTYQTIDNVVGWRVIMRRDMVSINNH